MKSEQEKWLDELNAEGAKISGEVEEYESSLCEVTNVKVGMTGTAEMSHPLLDTFDKGQAAIIIEVNVKEGKHKGELFELAQGLFNANGKVKVYYTFKGNDGKEVPASPIGEILHRANEYKEGQYKKDDPFHPDMLTGLQFKIGVRGSGGFLFAQTEYQRIKDQNYVKGQNSNPVDTNNEEAEGQVQETESVVNPNDLPF